MAIDEDGTRREAHRMDFYREVKWCVRCRRYVNYLLSLYSSYCVRCGGPVRLFSKTDMKKFKKQIAS